MIKILDSNKKNFYSQLDNILNKRKIIDETTLRTVKKIINNVRTNKDKALIYYEKKFNQNSEIIPNKKDISNAIKLLDPKIKSNQRNL